MKLCAIICELNPLTNGHEYIIKKAKELTGEEVLCLSSGDFVQRGEIAILSKFQRAMSAITAGASFVFELPCPYTISSANVFARGAVKVLDRLNCISHLAFGVETKNIDALNWIASVRANENQKLSAAIKKEAKSGNYSLAVKNALISLYPEHKADIIEVFSGSNNILAVEYLMALRQLNSSITPLFIQRLDNGYNSKSPAKVDGKTFASASYIRSLATEGNFDKIKDLVPNDTLCRLKQASLSSYGEYQSRLSAVILNNLRSLSKSELEKYYDYSSPVASLIHNAALSSATIDELVEKAAAKNLRESRARRLVLYPYLGLTKSVFQSFDGSPVPINVLAVKSDKKALLSQIIKQSKSPLLVSCSDRKKLSADDFLFDQLATDLYNLATKNKQSQDKALFL